MHEKKKPRGECDADFAFNNRLFGRWDQPSSLWKLQAKWEKAYVRGERRKKCWIRDNCVSKVKINADVCRHRSTQISIRMRLKNNNNNHENRVHCTFVLFYAFFAECSCRITSHHIQSLCTHSYFLWSFVFSLFFLVSSSIAEKLSNESRCVVSIRVQWATK